MAGSTRECVSDDDGSVVLEILLGLTTLNTSKKISKVVQYYLEYP